MGSSLRCQPEDFAGVCAGSAIAGSTMCVRHLRGTALAALDRRHWPRLRMAGGKMVAGDDAWRPWLREASGEELLLVLQRLGEHPAQMRAS